MTGDPKPRTGAANGQLWGASARDWAEIQEAQFAPGFAAALERAGVGPGTQLLDVGCGAGGAAALAAARGASVCGIDAAEPLLEIARERAPSGDFRAGDMEALPFADDAFDVVTGFNAFQFAGNPAAALREAGRVAKAGGTVVIMTWGNPEGMEAASLLGALRPLLPPPPPGAPGPFALSNEARLRAFAAEAGLAPFEVFDVDCAWRYPDEATALRGLGSSGGGARAAEIAGRGAVDAAHRAAVAPFRQADGSFRIGATARVLLACAG